MLNQDVHTAVEAQRAYFNSKKTLPLSFRLEMLKLLRKAILQFEDKLKEGLMKDLGKSSFESYVTEIGLTLEEITHQLKHLKKWMKPVKVKTPLVHFPSKSYLYSEPLGVSLVMSPWNYPFQLTILPLVGILAAGNCAVIKPSRYASNTAQVMGDMIHAFFPKEYLCVFQGGSEMNQALLAEKFDIIMFTGSPAVGKVVMEAASKYLTPVVLELGGKSPCVVESDADIELAGKRIAWGKFLNSGQTCVAPDYILVQKSVKGRLVETIRKYTQIYYGVSPEKSPDFPRIINDKHMERLVGYLKSGKTLMGGQYRMESRYISPTMLDSPSLGDNVMQEEIFGPILPVMEYQDLEEAMEFIRSRPKPLALYFFSKNKEKQRLMLEGTSSGGCAINDTVVHTSSSYLPFGGVGSSGMGHYHGKASYDTFSHQKPVMVKANWLDLPFRYAPYRGKEGLLKLFLK